MCSSRLPWRLVRCRDLDSVAPAATENTRGHGMASTSADVAIIGGGLMGCFSAYFLRRRGRSVVVIEKGRACAAASGVNFGNLRLQGRDPAEFPLSLGRRRSGRTLPASPERTAASFRAGTCIWDSRQATSPSWSRPRTRRAPPASTWSFSMGRAARRRWPLLSGVVTGASWSKRDAVADPAVASPAVARLASRAGAQTPRAHEGCRRRTDGTGFRLADRTGTHRDLRPGRQRRRRLGRGALRDNSASRCRCSPPDRRCSRSRRKTPTPARRCMPSMARCCCGRAATARRWLAPSRA